MIPGKVVGGRFRVERPIAEDAFSALLLALDEKTNKPITLRVFYKELSTPELQDALRGSLRDAGRLTHRNIVSTYGLANSEGAIVIASEWVDGATVAEIVEKRKLRDDPMSLRSVFNILSRSCDALAHAHHHTSHGGIRPSAIWLARSGRVKLADFGVISSLVSTHGPSVLSATDQACLAPEVKAGGSPTARSDVFGMGAIVYFLLTGKSPADGFVPPSQVHPEAHEEIDQVLLTCLAPDPATRIATAQEVRAAFRALLGEATEAPPVSEELGLEIDVEEDDLGLDIAVTSTAAPPPGGLVPPITIPQAPVPRESSAVDLSQMLAKITENDAPRWMVVKNGLDHGPFSAGELVETILKVETLSDHVILNMDSGVRKPLGEWPEFESFLEQQQLRTAEQQHKVALAQAERSERRGGVAKFIIGAAVLAVIGIVGLIFILTRESGGSEEIASADVDSSLYEAGEIAIEGTAGILPDPPRRRGRRRGGMGGGGMGGGGNVGTYEEAMNRAVELGDVSMGGSERRLSGGEVAGVMNRHVGRIYRGCVPAEQRRSGLSGSVTIDIAIAGSGSVLGASARQGSSQFKSCINRQVRSVRFPSFGAPRMGARYSFAVD